MLVASLLAGYLLILRATEGQDSYDNGKVRTRTLRDA